MREGPTPARNRACSTLVLSLGALMEKGASDEFLAWSKLLLTGTFSFLQKRLSITLLRARVHKSEP